jgi:hypothetical protein
VQSLNLMFGRPETEGIGSTSSTLASASRMPGASTGATR